MAKKYTSINFNHIYDKTTTNNTTSTTTTNSKSRNPSLSPSSSYSSPSYSAVSAPNKHGKILVLTRPTPKPVTPPIHSPSPTPSSPLPSPLPLHSQSQQIINQIPQLPDQAPSDAISLRPLGRTGSPIGSSLPTHIVQNDKEREKKDVAVISPKPDKFVPPHLRPGYVPREESPGPEVVRPRRQGPPVGSPVRYGEDGRPKSGGHERMRRGVGSDVGILGRPRSSGSSRPNSSG